MVFRQMITRAWASLTASQKKLLTALCVVAIFCLYFNMVFKPWQKSLLKLQLQSEQLKAKAGLMEVQSHPVDVLNAKKVMELKRKKYKALQSQLAEIREQLPRYTRVQALLEDIVVQAKAYSIDFVSVTPKAEQKHSGYSECVIDMKLTGEYVNFVNFLNHLEAFSRFFKVTDVAMEEPKEKTSGAVGATVTFSALLGITDTGAVPAKRAVAPVVPLELTRNPFESAFKPSGTVPKGQEFILSGILASGAQPTAIINNEVYKVNDRIKDMTVKQILPERVVLSDGKAEAVLTLESK